MLHVVSVPRLPCRAGSVQQRWGALACGVRLLNGRRLVRPVGAVQEEQELVVPEPPAGVVTAAEASPAWVQGRKGGVGQAQGV